MTYPHYPKNQKKIPFFIFSIYMKGENVIYLEKMIFF